MTQTSMKRSERYFIPEICVGSECNNACLFCSVGGHEAFPRKTLSEIKEEMKVLKHVASSIKFTGGEPTMRADIIDIISFAKLLGFRKIILETNGRMFCYEDFVKRVFEAGVTDFLISLHGHTPEIHDALTRVPKSFEQTVKGLKNLSKYYPRGVSVNVVITKYNYKHLPEIAKFLSKLPVKNISLSFVCVCGEAAKNKNVVPRKSDVMPYLKKCARYTKKISVNHFPLCVLKGYEKYSRFVRVPVKTRIVNPNYTITLESRLSEVMTKGKNCSECRYDALCEGLWKEYVNLYGFDEFVPVPGKRIRTIEEFETEFKGA